MIELSVGLEFFTGYKHYMIVDIDGDEVYCTPLDGIYKGGCSVFSREEVERWANS